MAKVRFKGFGGVFLSAVATGSEDDPSVLLVHGAGQTRAVWTEVAEALVSAGRRVITLELRGHGESDWPSDGNYAFDAMVEDFRSVLAQLDSRPVIVAAKLGGWIATVGLSKHASLLAAGLVLVDMPTRSDSPAAAELLKRLRHSSGSGQWDSRVVDADQFSSIADRLAAAAPAIDIPAMLVRGGLSELDSVDDANDFAASLPNCTSVDVEGADFLIDDNRIDAFNGLLLEFLETKQPRSKVEFREGSDSRTLRDALGCFATGVTVVTALSDEGTPIGLTANSFTSLSLDPPLLLVCIANSAGSSSILRNTKNFSVNVLQIGQQMTSNRFASKGEDRFSQTAWEGGEAGTPILTSSLAIFECRTNAVHDGGDHFILVGEVVRAQFEPRRDPLLYFRGKYRRLHFN